MRRTAVLGAAAAALLVAATPVVTTRGTSGPTDPVVPAVAPVGAVAPPAPATPAPPAAGAGSTTPPSDGAADPEPQRTAEGFLVAPGTSAAGSGPTLRYTVEVDPATGLDPADVAATADAALGDPRSWARDRRMVRVDDPTGADARVVVAPPDRVDALCAEAGLDTAGVYSCWNGRIVALNAWRWATGAAGFPDVATYRRYLVNHEVGHVLGLGHVGCPGADRPAPLMMQQSKGLDGCLANGWPHPEG